MRARLLPEDPTTVGTDPDYRFTLANERTLLAWIRTSLALTAGGLGAVVALKDLTGAHALGLVALSLALITAIVAPWRWARNEQAMRLGEPLPKSAVPQVMALATALLAVAAAVMLIADATG